MRSSNALRVEMPVARFFVCLALLLWSSAGLAEELRKNVALVIGNPTAKPPATLERLTAVQHLPE